MVARFSLATNYTYNGRDGGIIIDTTWFSVTAWQGDKITCINALQKGSKVHVIGPPADIAVAHKKYFHHNAQFLRQI